MENLERLRIANQFIAALITNDREALKSLILDADINKQIQQQLIAIDHRVQSVQILYSLEGIAVSFNFITGQEGLASSLISVLMFHEGRISVVNNYLPGTPQSDIKAVEKLKAGDQFLTALRNRDWTLMRSVLTADASWTLPGTSLLSGEAAGADAVINRAKQLRNFGVAVQLNNILTGEAGVTLSLHNTAMRGSLLLDEQVAIVCDVINGKICKITTHLNDVEGINAFFMDGII